MSNKLSTPDSDSDQLRKLGYTPRFDRNMTFLENFSLGFTYLSPMVGVYAVLVLGLTAGGPMMIWTYLVAGIGQLFVAMVFGEIVSQFPIAGGIYPWSRRLVGRRWSWIAGWVYGWALFATVAAISTGAGPFLCSLIGSAVTPEITTVTAIVMVIIGAFANLRGTKFLAHVAKAGFYCEMVGALGVGLYLLIFHRIQPLNVIFSTFNIEQGGSYLPAFLAASLAGLYAIYGFEACGDVAEETPDPGRRIPLAMRTTIIAGTLVCLVICLGLILAMPNLADVVAGKDPDPMGTLLNSAFGPFGSKIVECIILITFMSCLISPLAASGRLMFSYARDEMIIGSSHISRLSPKTHAPSVAILIGSIAAILIVSIGFFAANALTIVVSFATAGIYFAYLMVIAGALFARSRGWKPSGKFNLGSAGILVNIIALFWTAGAIINLAWPRTPDQPWFLNYATALGLVCVLVAGFVYMITAQPYARGDAPEGDAWNGVPLAAEGAHLN
ncbi:MAG: amino acid permease [Proteobacteria bacterium]|nr:amino acid permease [Pseudomonadota bacterium]